jgi:hypothetical protein
MHALGFRGHGTLAGELTLTTKGAIRLRNQIAPATGVVLPHGGCCIMNMSRLNGTGVSIRSIYIANANNHADQPSSRGC